MKQYERRIDVVASLPERLFIRFKEECFRRRKSEGGLIIEVLDKVLEKNTKN